MGTREAQLDYLSAYPQGLKQTEARTALAAIEDARMRAESEAWLLANEAGTQEALRSYLSSHPDGSNAPAARQMLAALAAADDDAAWSEARLHNTRLALSAYIAANPNGRHVESARARLASLGTGDAKASPVNRPKATKQAAPSDGKADARSALRWQSADEPFVGADGRIR